MEPTDLGTCFASGLRDRLTITYADRNGEVTQREIEVHEVWGKRGDVRGYAWVNWLVAFCLLRQEMRHFNARNILAVQTNFIVPMRGDDVQGWLAERYEIHKRKRRPKQSTPPQPAAVPPPPITPYRATAAPQPPRVASPRPLAVPPQPATETRVFYWGTDEAPAMQVPKPLNLPRIVGFGLLAAAALVAFLLFQHERAKKPELPLSVAPALPALAQVVFYPNAAYLIGLGLGCEVERADRTEAMSLARQSIERRDAGELREQMIAEFNAGLARGEGRLPDRLCERGVSAVNAAFRHLRP